MTRATKLNVAGMSALRNRLTGSSGLTLIELLVVIAIIGLLAAIAIPVFKRTIKSAEIAQSTSNLRQISAMAHGYVAEHNGSLPAYQSEEEDSGWDTLLLAYSTGMCGDNLN